MTTYEYPEQLEADAAIIPAADAEVVAGGRQEPVAPAMLSPDEIADLQARAAALVNQLGEAGGSKELQLIDSVAGLGVQAQRRTASELDLLRGRMKDIFTQEGPSAELWTALMEMRSRPHADRPAATESPHSGPAALRLPCGRGQVGPRPQGAGANRHPS